MKNRITNNPLRLSIGDRLIFPKSLFNIVQHHCVYLGRINGVECFIENKQGKGVQLISADHILSEASSITRIVKFQPSWYYSESDLIKSAIYRIGTSYDLVNYNCEHFANEISFHI